MPQSFPALWGYPDALKVLTGPSKKEKVTLNTQSIFLLREHHPIGMMVENEWGKGSSNHFPGYKARSLRKRINGEIPSRIYLEATKLGR